MTWQNKRNCILKDVSKIQCPRHLDLFRLIWSHIYFVQSDVVLMAQHLTCTWKHMAAIPHKHTLITSLFMVYGMGNLHRAQPYWRPVALLTMRRSVTDGAMNSSSFSTNYCRIFISFFFIFRVLVSEHVWVKLHSYRMHNYFKEDVIWCTPCY